MLIVQADRSWVFVADITFIFDWQSAATSLIFIPYGVHAYEEIQIQNQIRMG